MYQITKNSEKQGLTAEGTAEKIKKILIKCNLPYEIIGVDVEGIKETILRDKKRKGSSINLVLIKKIGDGYLENIDIKKIDKFI